MGRTILHCDMNSFFASVELLDHPELRDVPMAVCGSADTRHGIILAKNDLAKSYGVVPAETLWQARKKCPGLQTVPPHHEKYTHYSKLINKIYLAKCFKRVTDSTLLQYHNLIRCEKAAELLRTTDLSIEIISGQVGYATASHFSRTFRIVYHCSPMEYRKGKNGRID